MPFSATSGDISYYFWPEKKTKEAKNAISFILRTTLAISLYPLPSSRLSLDGFARWLQPGQAGHGLMQSFLSGNVQVRTSRFVASALASDSAWAEAGLVIEIDLAFVCTKLCNLCGTAGTGLAPLTT